MNRSHPIKIPAVVPHDLVIDGQVVRIRRTNFHSGQTFQTIPFGPDGWHVPGVPTPVLVRPSQLAIDDALRRLEEHRAAWIGRFIAEHPGEPVCYWYNWLVTVLEQPIGILHGGGHRYRIVERGCPAIDHAALDRELEYFAGESEATAAVAAAQQHGPPTIVNVPMPPAVIQAGEALVLGGTHPT